MKIHLLRDRATPAQVADMLQALKTYIKLAVDIERGIAAGGGEMHADCEQILLEAGSRQENIWGADWYPDNRQVRFEALINLRPRQGNRSMEIKDPAVRMSVEQIVRSFLEASS